MSDPLFFEDFPVGARFESGITVMERDAVIGFARQFDPQPQHLSEAEAAASSFGELVASGWHTAAVAMRQQLDAALGRVPGGAMGAQVDRLSWRRPVRPGDALRTVLEVLDRRDSRSRPDKGVLSLRTTTLNGAGEVVMEMEAAVLVPKRPAR